MTTIEEFSERPFAAVCLALRMIGVDLEPAATQIPLEEARDDFRIELSLSQDLALCIDHDPSEGVLSLVVLFKGTRDRQELLHHALALNDLLPRHRRISLDAKGAPAVRGYLTSGAAGQHEPDEIAAEAADLFRIAELLLATSDPADAPAVADPSSGRIIRG